MPKYLPSWRGGVPNLNPTFSSSNHSSAPPPSLPFKQTEFYIAISNSSPLIPKFPNTSQLDFHPHPPSLHWNYQKDIMLFGGPPQKTPCCRDQCHSQFPVLNTADHSLLASFQHPLVFFLPHYRLFLSFLCLLLSISLTSNIKASTSSLSRLTP